VNWGSDLAREIDGAAHFVEKVDTKNSVDLSATRFADGAEVKGRQLQMFKTVVAPYPGESAYRRSRCAA
jgi:hypothetical protein